MSRIDHSLSWFAANRDALALGLLVALALVAAMLVARWVGARMVAADPDRMDWKRVVGSVLARTSLAFMLFAAADIVTTYAEPPPRIGRLVDIGFIIAFALQAAVWAREIILGVIRGRVGEDPGSSTLGNAMSIIRVLVSVALFAIAIIVIFDNLGVNVTALVAGLGIGGIAIGLAAQGIFADLFAALAIVFDRPFRRGDLIRFDNTIGTVERIGLKTTRLRSLSGEQVIMANTKLLERELHNLAEARARRITLAFALGPDTAPGEFDRFAAAASEAVTAIKGLKPVRVVLTSLAGSNLNAELVYDDKARDNDLIARNRSAVLAALVGALNGHDIALAAPAAAPGPAAPASAA